GGLGGHGGRALRPGDVLRLAEDVDPEVEPTALPAAEGPVPGRQWDLGVVDGPHADPEFLTREGMDELCATAWEVHFNSARTGVRLVGPKPRWARTDGGEAGLHPSNIHDPPYSVGARDYTGDMPILLGPDGPSLGGFVCPATVLSGERWKLGQMRPGDTVRFVRVGGGGGGAGAEPPPGPPRAPPPSAPGGGGGGGAAAARAPPRASPTAASSP